MRTYKYIGLFTGADGNEHSITVNCNGTIQAFFLLTADAIRNAKHYQLNTITDEDSMVTKVDDILHVGKLLS
ncbi:MAG: hypothetical protein HRT42_13760 [Campylobacteraceae bacterium]|nr:hypothetical protein [Campylobacteraceae bacterium]